MTLPKFEQSESTSQNAQSGEHTHHLYHQVNQLRASGHDNHGGQGHANKADAHLPSCDIVGDTTKATTKAIDGATHAVGDGINFLWNASGEEANHLWSELDKTKAGQIYKHNICQDNIVAGALAAPMVAGGAIGLGLIGGAIAAADAPALLATGAFATAIGAMAAVGDYGKRHSS
jgi:uncharacterized protein (DUF2147 family)